MSLVFAGVCSHAPGITGRAKLADPKVRDELYANYDRMRERIEATKPDALIVVAAEHFANFFMNNMPAYCMGMAEHYEGPIEDEEWLAIKRHKIPGNPDLSGRLIRSVMEDTDLAYAEEWKFDHGIMVPLNFLTPRYDLPVVPVNINCQGPPLTPPAPGLAIRSSSAPRLRRATRAHRAGRYGRSIALAGHARLRRHQRSLGPSIPRPLHQQPQG